MPKLPANIEFLGEVTTTMDAARERIAAYAGKPFGIVGEAQVKGRGTGGRIWKSPKGNMYFTLCVPQGNAEYLKPDLMPVVPLMCGLACRRAMLDIIPAAKAEHIQTKWPNDIIYQSKKIGGTLVESEDDYFLVGMGMNVNVAPPVTDAGRASTTLNQIAADLGSTPTTPEELATKVWEKFFDMATDANLKRADIVKEFSDAMDFSLELHKRLAEGRDPEPLKAVSLNEWGHLVVRHVDGTLETLCADYLF